MPTQRAWPVTSSASDTCSRVRQGVSASTWSPASSQAAPLGVVGEPVIGMSSNWTPD
jgi:hypothetical protein